MFEIYVIEIIYFTGIQDFWIKTIRMDFSVSFFSFFGGSNLLKKINLFGLDNEYNEYNSIFITKGVYVLI